MWITLKHEEALQLEGIMVGIKCTQSQKEPPLRFFQRKLITLPVNQSQWWISRL